MTTTVTKFNGTVSVAPGADGLPVATFVATDGIVGQMMDGLSTLFDTQKVAVGNGALFQRLALPVAGNMLATHSETGKLGVSAFGKNFLIGA